jgi:transposase InsO family protein
LVSAALKGYKGLVNNRLYLKWVPPHRCHTYHVDHTTLDLWVWPSHKHRSPIRPHVTVVVDGHSGLLHAVPWNAEVNGDMIAAALVDATVEHDYHGVKVGGQPEQVILDNAAAHFGPAMRAGVERLGWILAPTAAYSSWQNGKAERAIGMLNKRLANRAPGATNAGTTRTGAPRNVARLPKDIKPDDVWSWKAFTLALQAEVDDINTTIKVKRLGGLTRLQAYDSDPTERRAMPQAEATLAMLTSGDKTYTATKNGINFGGVDYVDSCLEYGRKYLIRYLPTQRDFIEVFDLTGEHVGTAYDPDRIPKDQRSAFMAERARQEYDAQAIEFGVRAHRRHQAAADNAGVNYEETPPAEPTGAPEKPVKAVDRLDRSKGEKAVPKTRASRPQQPRVPATEPPPETSVPDTMRARLEAVHGKGLQKPTTNKNTPRDDNEEEA